MPTSWVLYFFLWNSVALKSFIQSSVDYVQTIKNLIGGGFVEESANLGHLLSTTTFPYSSGIQKAWFP